MNDFDRRPGGIDDPGMKGGTDPDVRRLPPGDTAGDVADHEPRPAQLDLPGPDDPVAWNYVTPGTEVVGPNGTVVGKVGQMLGTQDEGIFHGVAVAPDDGGAPRVVPADAVVRLTPARIEVAWDAGRLAEAEEYTAPDAR